MRFFYVAVAETRPDYVRAIIDTIREWDERMRRHGIRVGILVRYTKWRSRQCLPCRLAREYGLPVFVDNGAFSFLSDKELETWPRPEKLSFWLGDYAEWLGEHYEEFDHAALPDLPVHGQEFLGPRDRMDRILLSTLLQVRLLRKLPPKIRARMVPVLQGYTLREYAWSYRLLEKHLGLEETAFGGPGEYARVIAVGSICVRKPSAAGKTGVLADGAAAGTLDKVMRPLLNDFPPGIKGFHFFGLHAEATRKWGRHPRFYAADSGAHGLNYRYKWKTVLGCEAPNTPSCAAKAVDRQLRRTLQPLLHRPILEYA